MQCTTGRCACALIHSAITTGQPGLVGLSRQDAALLATSAVDNNATPGNGTDRGQRCLLSRLQRKRGGADRPRWQSPATRARTLARFSVLPTEAGRS